MNNIESELILPLNKLKIAKKKLGSGVYGTVYSTKDSDYAYKKYKINDCMGDGLVISFLREIAAIKLLKASPYIIDFISVDIKCDKIKFFMPRYYSDLSTFIKTNGSNLTSQRIKSICFQIIHGLYDAYCLSIVHRDLKPQNILVNPDDSIVICDWGISRFMEIKTGGCFTSPIQTLWYRSPELLLGQKQYGTNIDIWSFGIIMVELYNGKSLFNSDCEIQHLYNIFSIFGTPSIHDWPGIDRLCNYRSDFPKWKSKPLKSQIQKIDDDGLDLVEKILQINPNNRITIIDAINHKYFESVREFVFVEKLLDYSLIKNNQYNIDINQMTKTQTNINFAMRKILIDWLIEVKGYYRLSHGIFFLACQYIDIYLSKKKISKLDLQLLGITAIFIASKIMKVDPLSIFECIKIVDNAYNSTELKNMEIDLCIILDYDFYQSTEFTFFYIFGEQRNFLGNEHYRESLKLLYMTIINKNSRKYKPEKLALVVIYYYFQSKDIIDYWTSMGFLEEERLELVEYLSGLLNKSYSVKLVDFFNKLINSNKSIN